MLLAGQTSIADAAIQEPSDILNGILTSNKTRQCWVHSDLFVSVCILVGVQCVSAAEEQWQGRSVSYLLFLTLLFQQPSPLNPHTPFWITPTRLDISGLEWAPHWPVLSRSVPLWGTLTVNRLIDTPLHMLTSILPGTDVGWCSGYPPTSPSTTRQLWERTLYWDTKDYSFILCINVIKHKCLWWEGNNSTRSPENVPQNHNL